MKNAARLTALMALLALITLTAGSASATETVSPGALDRLAVVETRCPTFSWGADDGAAAYDLVAYVLPEDAALQVELTADTEALFARVAAGHLVRHGILTQPKLTLPRTASTFTPCCSDRV